MLSIIGDILNWMAAGVLFPLLFLPAGILGARMVKGGAWTGALIWLSKVIASVGLGTGFLMLLPGSSITTIPFAVYPWLALMTVAAILMGLSGGPGIWAAKILPLTNSFTRLAGRGAMWFVLVMALVQFLVVILRYVFGLSFIWMQESITYMHGAVFLLAAGYALMTDDHVRVDIFYRGASARIKAWINLYGTYLLLAPVCLLLLWAASPYIYASWAATEGSNESSGVQLLFLLKSFIPTFGVLMLLAGFDLAMRAVAVLVGDDPEGIHLGGHALEGQI